MEAGRTPYMCGATFGVWSGWDGMGLIFQSGNSQRRVKGSEALSRGSVQVRGESVFYEAAGMAEDGPTVVFLHESGGSSATWHGQLTGMAQRARCIVPDLPGHGRSEGAGYATVAEYRDVVLAFLDALAIQWSVVVAGVCLGAAIAADLARHAPDRVSGLILCGVSPAGRACDQTREATARGEVRDGFVASLFGPGASQRLVNERLQRWRLTSPVARHSDLTAVRSYPIREAVSTVRQPTLIVAGEQDAIATPDLARTLVSTLADGRGEVISRAGCLCMAEQSAAFNRVASDFLSRVRPEFPVGLAVPRLGGYRRFL